MKRERRDEMLEDLRARVIALGQQAEDGVLFGQGRLRAMEAGLTEIRAALRDLAAEVARLREKVEPGVPRVSGKMVREFLDATPVEALTQGIEAVRPGDPRIAPEFEGTVRRYVATALPVIAPAIAENTLGAFVRWMGGRPPRGRRRTRGAP